MGWARLPQVDKLPAPPVTHRLTPAYTQLTTSLSLPRSQQEVTGLRKTQVCSPFTNQHSLLFHSLLLSIEGALLAGVFGESQLLTRGAGLLPPAGQVVH